MLIVLSPAKTLDYETPHVTEASTMPAFVKHSAELVKTLKTYSPAQIGSLMGISDQLAALNAGRFASWSTRRFTAGNARQAILAFNGDVYEGLDAPSLTPKQLAYAQSHIRILSGLYGLLRPLDLMQPYRLEMGTALPNSKGKNLYAFWGTALTDALNQVAEENKAGTLVNLASEEYFKAVQPKGLHVPVVTPVFEDWKGGRYKVISFHAKRARGLMARFAATKSIRHAEKLKSFDLEGYGFCEEGSTDSRWVFRRKVEL